LLGLFLNRDAEPYLNAKPDGNAELYRRLSVESFASEVLRKVLRRPPVKSCARRDRYFGECTSESTIGGRWMTPEKCARYAPLFGPRSQYKFKEPACPWRQGDRVSKACQYYCYYTEPYGVSRINHPLWQAAQRGEAQVWKGMTGNFGDRVGEALQGFRHYKKVRVPLGHVLEIGCGPFTQSGFLIDELRSRGVDPGVTSVTLADPGIESYLVNTPGCAYKDGKLRGYPVTTQAHGGETIDFPPASFDTVVTINVLEHCEDAFEYMHRMHRVLKPGGLLIFHERVYDNFWKVLDPVTHSSEVAGWHPLRVKRKLVDTLLKHYEVQLYSVDLTREMVKRKRTQIAEEPLWIIARKINATHP